MNWVKWKMFLIAFLWLKFTKQGNFILIALVHIPETVAIIYVAIGIGYGRICFCFHR